MKETFGEYIRMFRIQNNLTLTQLAAMLDLDSANLSKIENGKRDFDDKRLEKLAIALKLNIDEVKKEYYSDFIAKKLYASECDKDTLLLAEQKVEYLKQKKSNKEK